MKPSHLAFAIGLLISTNFAAAAGSTSGYVSYLTGPTSDVTPSTQPGVLLVGGGTDQDDAMQWMVDHSGLGNFVVLRASGADGYNTWLMDKGAFSVESFVISSRAGAEDPYVLNKLQNAEAIFFAGGDQSLYVDYFKGTQLAAIVNEKALTVPVGGTSAGLAILGQWIYGGHNSSITSAEALVNPYNHDMNLDRDFLKMPNVHGIITDSHFGARDRMGRLVTFLSRIVQGGWGQVGAHAVGIDEATALALSPDGTAKHFGLGNAYMLTTTQAPSVCEANVPLTVQGVAVHRLGKGETFDVNTWSVTNSGSGSADYTLSVDAGIIKSNQSNGSAY